MAENDGVAPTAPTTPEKQEPDVRLLHVDPTLRAASADLESGLNRLKAEASVAVGEAREKLMAEVEEVEDEIEAVYDRLRTEEIVDETHRSGPA